MTTIDIDIAEGPPGPDGLPTYNATERGSSHSMDGAIRDVIDPGRNFLKDPSRIGERLSGIWDHLQRHHAIPDGDEPVAQRDGVFNDPSVLFPPPEPWRYAKGGTEVNVHDVPSRPEPSVGVA